MDVPAPDSGRGSPQGAGLRAALRWLAYSVRSNLSAVTVSMPLHMPGHHEGER